MGPVMKCMLPHALAAAMLEGDGNLVRRTHRFGAQGTRSTGIIDCLFPPVVAGGASRLGLEGERRLGSVRVDAAP